MTYQSLLLETEATSGTTSTLATLLQMMPLILLLFLLWFLMIRPQRKREKAVQTMRSNLEIGDEVVTIGGVIGRVVSMHDDFIVVESGPDRTKIRMMRWAVQQNNTAVEKENEARAQAKQAKAKSKEK